MLKDRVRTLGYRDAICNNPHLFKDKVILDVGCGTGILSMFAVSSGAKRVIAVDNSNIINVARANAAENHMEKKILFIKNKIELVEELPQVEGEEVIHQVDVIISEWMGYCLLFECMLPSILVARDRFCGGGGLVLPDVSSIYLSAWSNISFYGSFVTYWEDVYGYKMSDVKKYVTREPHVTNLPRDSLVSDPVLVKRIDANTAKIEEIDFTSDFELLVNVDQPLHGFVAYFDIAFSRGCTHPVLISTGSQSERTHWDQTIFLLEDDSTINLNKGDKIVGQFGCKRNVDSHRDLDIYLSFSVSGKIKKELMFCLS
eukprot:TRINITY_DN6764_c0_g1_i29.p1 TRINITY_DN6764_c0_g1~~TRINITY_DN6764_c0_g1_i29.p1  ORF type:complete len:315 (-),score=75.91 TRINITY_DN6764_c0_g1_i29:22-966(-)